ncbi:MAG: hypothetical protein IIA45_11730, partial [Bacteroidetes bacterium]|nr:hypothetical protein [Bacteroidota bacterium]
MRYPYLIILLFAIACSNSEEQTQEVSENHLEQFNKNEKWIAGCKDNKSDTFINIFKEADGYVVENILGGERKRVSVAECIKLEESDLGSKSWQEIILFKNADANIDIKITIRGGQALTDPIITAVFGQYQGIVIKIDSTQVFAKYEKEHMLQQSNLKFSMLSCSNPNEETFPYYIEYKGENPSVKAEFHQFWLKFAEALLENDEETIIELTVFPFITPSPMDVWPDKVYETPWEFMIVLDEFLVWYVDAYLGTGNFSEYFYEYGISALKLRDEMAEKGSMRFHKIEGEWKLVSIYLEPATFTELENIIETY